MFLLKKQALQRSFGLLILCSPAVLLAEDAATQLAKGNGYSGYFIKMILSMLLIIGMLAAFAWYTRRFGMGMLGHKPNDHLQVISMLSLGAKERIVMVQAGDDQLILGLVPGEIRKLHVIKNTKSSDTDSKNFSKHLSSEINKSKAGKAS